MRHQGPRRTQLAALALALSAAAAGPASADDTVSRADALFAEGVKLRDSNLELACAKFGESLQLNPQAIGVLLNVAMCDEKYGRFASAVRRYRETRARAIEQSFPEYRKAAEAKLALLEPEVPHLTIRFEQSPPPPQTKVVVDDQVVPVDQLVKVPLDPGDRIIVISAPGHLTFERRISLGKAEDREISVPALARPSSRRTIGKISVAAGGAALATGVILGIVANAKYDSAIGREDALGKLCMPGMSGRLVCRDGAYGDVQSARTLGTVGTIVGAAGIAGALVGGYLWLYAPKRPYGEQRRVTVVPEASAEGAGIAVIGRF